MPPTSSIPRILKPLGATCASSCTCPPLLSKFAAPTLRPLSTARLRPSPTTAASSAFAPAPATPAAVNATALIPLIGRPATAASPFPQQQLRGLSSMASDDDYMAFLNKANKDADDARASAAAAAQGAQQGQPPPFKALDAGSQVPRVILDAIRDGAVYVSDADEPFDGVSLRWSGKEGLPDEETFARLIGHWDAANADIEIMDPTDWDRHEQYGNIVAAVTEATKGNDVRVYRVPRDKSTRVEYWVVSRDDSTGSLVGVKALGVES